MDGTGLPGNDTTRRAGKYGAGRHPLPLFAAKIIRLANRRTGGEDILGDFEEEYGLLREESGQARAGFWLAVQLAKMIWGKGWNHLYWQAGMFSGYSRMAVRGAKKAKVFTIVNLAGLSIAIASCIFIFLWITDELYYDDFHSGGRSIFQVLVNTKGQKNISTTPVDLGPALAREFPQVEAATRYHWLFAPPVLSNGTKTYRENALRFVDPSFLTIFSFELVSGDPLRALDGPGSIVITEEVAARYFPWEDPLGKILTLNGEHQFTVTGVLRSLPKNSTLRFDILAPIDFRIANSGDWYTAWNNNFSMTFIKVADGTDAAGLESLIAGVIPAHGGDESATLALLPLRQRYMHFFSDIEYVYIFAGIAVLILLLAGFNYVNLTTARSAARVKEIALRKTVGAFRGDVITQLLFESVLTCLAAGAVAVAAAWLLLPLFNSLTGKDAVLDYRTVALATFSVSIITGILGGIYPAVFISSLKPAPALKSRAGSNRHRRSTLRKSLVIFQFSVTIALMIGVAVIQSQLRFLYGADTGYDRDNVVSIRMGGGTEAGFQLLKERLLENADITGVTGTGSALPYVGWQISGCRWEGMAPDLKVSVNYNVVDYDFTETMDIDIVNGRTFSREFSDESSPRYLVNGKMAALMGIANPTGLALNNGDEHGEIVGVVRDFNFSSLDREIGPLVVKLEPISADNMLIRVGGDIPRAVGFIEETWKSLFPGHPFSYTFLNDDYLAGYRSEAQRGKLLNSMTLLAVIIASLGLFGLASFTSAQRTKEIGIRKVLGASSASIFALLTREFAACLALSALIACPAGYLMMKRWLYGFAYRTSLEPWMFAAPVAAAVIVSLIAVSRQSLKAVTSDPVESLRYE